MSVDYAVELRDVSFAHASTKILSGVDLKVEYRESVAIMGKSGAGKTTLLKIIAGLLTPEKGHVRVLGQDLQKNGLRDLKGKIAYIPQSLGLVDCESALYNVLLARAPIKTLRFLSGLWSGSDVREAIEALKTVGLNGKYKNKVEKLSGGEKQRVVIARAIFQKASLLLADEPVSNLDFETAEKIVKLMVDLKRRGLTIISVTHDRELTFKYFDKIYLLENSSLREIN
ncbi:MAG: ATP-binding cassette domain-containing protein [Archaeoglobaceae archaeon]